MTNPSLYPPSPTDVPADLTTATASYKRHAWLVLLGLLVFILLYWILLAAFSYIAYRGADALANDGFGVMRLVITSCSALLAVFMIKALFAVRRAGDPGGIEVTAQNEPRLFEFLHRLADEVGAPKPHRVFLTAEVNAAVFYDLSLLNLFFPSRKNLIIGVSLVNVLSLGELKAVLAHEFGHFAQGSMIIGRWVYIAQQVIAHMVATRDWLDALVRGISRFDLRIAWLGWILAIILWSIRSLVDTLFRIVIIAERALSREMEFNADLVAVSITGSDALISALHKLQAADQAWQTALNVAQSEAANNRVIEDLFAAQTKGIEEIRNITRDEDYGQSPPLPQGSERAKHRVFKKASALPPQMWATHPANSDREDNAKHRYIASAIDERSAWVLFSEPEKIRKTLSLYFYDTEKLAAMELIPPSEAVEQRFARASYSPEYRGTYLSRSIVRNFASVKEILEHGTTTISARESLATLYPASLTESLEMARNLEHEIRTLEALAAGELKPSGGVIRHRGEEIGKNDIPNAVEAMTAEKLALENTLKAHDASCRRAHLQAAAELGNGWQEFLLGLLKLLHCSEHLCALVDNEHNLLVNTWQVITADGQIGYFEKRRILRVCRQVNECMVAVTNTMKEFRLPQTISDELGITDWNTQCPQFDFIEVTKKNWVEWCQAASENMTHTAQVLSIISHTALEQLISTEALIKEKLLNGAEPGEALTAGVVPENYPVLMPGDEHELQYKLDLWNRFQLAHGFFPALARLAVSTGIVGGTIISGIIGV